MTGWGQTGPLAATAGHDINYIAVTGALHAAARHGRPPTPPANLLGDFGGGGMYLVTAVLAALVERARTGTGRVLDVAITDGTTYLASMLYGMHRDGQVAGRGRHEPARHRRARTTTCTAAPTAATSRSAPWSPSSSRRWPICSGSAAEVRADRDDPARWPALRAAIAAAVLTRTRDEWAALAAGTDACLAPVLNLSEAPLHGQAVAREIFADGMPRLPIGRATATASAADVVRAWGVTPNSPPRSRAGADAGRAGGGFPPRPAPSRRGWPGPRRPDARRCAELGDDQTADSASADFAYTRHRRCSRCPQNGHSEHTSIGKAPVFAYTLAMTQNPPAAGAVEIVEVSPRDGLQNERRPLGPPTGSI